MRTLLKLQVPVDAGNTAITTGTLPTTLQNVMNAIKPEAAYFYAEDGVRTAIMVFDMKSPSDIPSIAEPLFTQFKAKISMSPVMNLDDLAAGLKKIQAAV
jgi:hypothetical protein